MGETGFDQPTGQQTVRVTHDCFTGEQPRDDIRAAC